ncbi:MAG TPA: retroviral-like aspartic protease family protein [Rhizomicrobium sp.]|jgi:predicted aspartyl protease
MIRAAVAFVLALGLAGTAFADPSPPRPACTLNELASLDLTMEPSGVVSIPVAIDNQPARFTIDTGALLSVVSDSVADQLKLERKRLPIELMMPGGVKTRSLAVADTFTIGKMTARSLALAVIPTSALLGFEADGLLGPDILSNYDIDLDFAHAKFNIFSQDHCEGNVVYWAKGGSYAKIPFRLLDHLHIAAPVVLDGKTITAVIDTGAERTMMPLSAARALGIDVSAANVTSERRSVNGTAASVLYRYPFQTLALEGVTISHPDIDIGPDFNLGGAQILLGIETLRQLHLYIAYKERALYVTPAEAGGN